MNKNIPGIERLRTCGQIEATGLGDLNVRPRKARDASAEPLDYRPCCYFCGAHTCWSALEKGRVVEVAAGALMACPGDDPPLKAVSDCSCAVCATCDETLGITQQDNLSARQAFKL